MPINNGMDELSYRVLHDRIVLSNDNEKSIVECNNMDESQNVTLSERSQMQKNTCSLIKTNV